MANRRNDLVSDRRAHPRVAVATGQPIERRRIGRPLRASEPADQRMPIYLTASEKRALEGRAENLGTSVSELVRDAVDDYLEDIDEPKVFSSASNSKHP